MRLALADAAEFVSKTAGSTAESLRELDSEIEQGERNEIGIRKSSGKGDSKDKDAKVRFERAMDTAKVAGSKVIGAGQVAVATSEELANRTGDRLQEAYYKVRYRYVSFKGHYVFLTTVSRYVKEPKITRITTLPSLPSSTSLRSGSTSLWTRLATSTQIPHWNLSLTTPLTSNT